VYHYNQTGQRLAGADSVNIIRTIAKCPLLEQNCSVNLAGGIQLDIALSPKGLPTLEPLELRISSSSTALDQIQDIQIWFEGRDMDMGLHYFNLIFLNDQIVGKGMIPICTIDASMVWQLNVAFIYQGKNNILMLN